jgi:diaminopropionate ammonia-lyase
MQVVENRSSQRCTALTAAERAIVGTSAPEAVRCYVPVFPSHRETPLVRLPNLARQLGLGGVAIKDEGQRHGLSSFKALGGAYAVARLVRDHVQEALGREIEPAELLGEESRAIARNLTVSCATDGNHGRSVAAGAQRFGCRCVIFLHSGVSPGREAAIRAFGAEIRRTDGNYDQSVEEASATAEREGWITVSDFAWEGYTDIPGMVMQGYTIILDEVMGQSPVPYSHVFVQGGVGGLAAVVAGYLLDRFGDERPSVVVVEPSRANCLQVSAREGRRTAIAPGEGTVMAMLECYEPSLVAWAILEKAADFYVDVSDEQAVGALRQLARPLPGDPALTIGESGAAGLAGLMAAAGDASARAKLELDRGSNVLLFGTEGATDPDLYAKLLTGEGPLPSVSHGRAS